MEFTPKDPNFAARVNGSFAKQNATQTIGATLIRVAPGEADVAMPVSPHVCQQYGFVHGGIVSMLADCACGYAAFSLMPAGVGILTVEFKMNFLAPAAGERVVATGRVIRPGHLLTITQAEVTAERGDERTLCAVMIATMMAMEDRSDLID